MADPTTILDYIKQRRAAAQQAAAKAQQRLAQAQASLAAASQALAAATADFAALNKQADEIRAKLAAVPTPADGDALLDALEQLIIRSRTQRAAVLKNQGALDAAKTDAENAEAAVKAAQARLADAEAQVKQAEQEQKQRDKLKAALAAPPLSTVSAKADDALKGKPFTDAKARIEADFPAKLRTRAKERLAAERLRLAANSNALTGAEDALHTEVDTNGGLTGKASPSGKKWAEFVRAEDAAREFAGAAQTRFEQTQATLARVADARQLPLTPEQSARINDAALKAAREAAADEEKTRDAKWKDLNDARDKLDSEVLKAKAAGKVPGDEQAVKDAQTALATAQAAFDTADAAWHAKEKDRNAKLAELSVKQAALAKAIRDAIAAGKDPETDAGVAAAKTALAAAQSALKTAEDAYKQSNHGILHAWQAAVPDANWQLLLSYEEAVQSLETLKAAKPGDLKTNLETAEADAVKARLDADASTRVLVELAVEQRQRAGRRQSALQNESQRLFGALRGDS